MISINVYFGYNFNFFVIKILSVHYYSHFFFFSFFFLAFCHSWSWFLSRFSTCREKRMCLLQHNGNGNAVFVFVAASRNDQAPQSVPHSAIGHLSLNHSLKNCFSSAFASWRIYANLYLCVCVCVFVNIHIFRNMCMGANIYNTT